MLMAVLALCGTLGLSSCSKTHGNSEEQSKIAEIAGKVWAFSQTHPDGFTIDVRTMTECGRMAEQPGWTLLLR